MPGYSQRPSVTKDRLWLQVPDLVLKLYHSFPLFPNKVDNFDTSSIETIDLIFYANVLVPKEFSELMLFGEVSL